MIRARLLLLLPLSACVHTPAPTTSVCCQRCDRVWSEEELDAHERHRLELNLTMYASGCEYCRYHGAYKDVKSSRGIED